MRQSYYLKLFSRLKYSGMTLLASLLMFSCSTAFAQTSKNVILRTGPKQTSSRNAARQHAMAMKQIHEKHKEAMEARLKSKKSSKAMKTASVRKPRLPNSVNSITVNSTADADTVSWLSDTTSSGTITLRSAIDYADSTGSVDTIFVPAGTYNLSLGELDIEQPVVIQGGGAGSTVVSGGGASRVFQIDNGPVTIVDLTVTRGYDLDGYGGGILVSGDSTVDLDSVNVTDSRADYGGGGLAIVGSATVTAKNCTFTYDSTTVGGEGDGGAISNNDGNLTIDHCIFTHNYGDGESGAIDIDTEGGTDSISNSVIDSNYSPNYVGGIGCWGTSLVMVNDTVGWNSVGSGGADGGVYVDNPVVIHGGAIIFNTASYEGGIEMDSSPDSLFDVTIYGNSAASGYGGGVYFDDSPVYFSNVKVDSNSSGGAGGGMYDDNGGLTWIGGSLSKNAASGEGGGLYFDGESNDTLSSVTVAGNSPDNIYDDTYGAHRVLGAAYATDEWTGNIFVSVATVNGSVSPNGVSTTVRFLYGTVSGNYTDSVSASPATVNGDTMTSVSSQLTGLNRETTYYYRVSAVSTSPANYFVSGEGSFTTNNPYATADSATNIATSSATLYGTVVPGSVSTVVRFLYGTISGNYPDSVNASPSSVNGTTGTSVSGALSGLTAGVTYYYRVSGTSSSPSNYFVSDENSFVTTVTAGEDALSFNSSNDGFVEVPNSSSLDLTTNYTIEAWIKPHSFSWLAGIVSKYQTSGSNGYFLRLTSGYPYTGIGFDGMETTDGILAADTWYHIAAVNNGGTRTLYVNGIEVPLSLTPETVASNTDPLTIGVDFLATPRYFDGVIDEVRIYNVALGSTQIREDMHRTLSGSESGLVGYWKFDEGSGATAYDQTSNANNGTLQNFGGGGETWLKSTASLGSGTSVDVAGFTSGTASLGTVSLTTTDDFDNPVELVCTKINNSPNVEPSTSGQNLDDRYWVITPYGTPGTFSTNLIFTVPSAYTKDGSESPSAYTLYQRDDNSDGSWDTLVASASSVTSTTIEFDNVTSLCQLMIGSSATDIALAVQATDFLATADVGSVTLSWKTQSEVNNAGFNILRSLNSEQGTLNYELIASYTSNNSLKGMGTSTTGRTYKFTDTKVTSGSTYEYKIQSVSTNGTTEDLTTLSVKVDIPKNYALYQNYPNPFNPSTTIRFDLKESSTVTLEVYNVLGQRVMRQNYGTMDAGRYNENVNMDRFASGVYFYRVSAVGNDGQRFVAIKKLMLMK